MKSKTAPIILSATTGLSLVLSGCATTMPPADGGANSTQGAEATTQAVGTQSASTTVSVDYVQGTFTFSQAAVDDNNTIGKALAEASKIFCGANDTSELEEVNLGEWSLAVTGDVQEAFVLSEDELAHNEYEKQTMKCICIGNPADGKSAVQGSVHGIAITDLLNRAQPDEGVNTIIFTSADGYEVALPLNYVKQRASLIVYAINGEGLDASVGGHNQLWLGATAARYFARDIVAIELATWDEAPAAPGSKEAQENLPNSPNVAVVNGE